MHITSVKRPDLNGTWTYKVVESAPGEWLWIAYHNGGEAKFGGGRTRSEADREGRHYMSRIKTIAARDNPTPWEWAGIVGAGVGLLAGGIALAVVLTKPSGTPSPTPPGPTPPPGPQPSPPNVVVNPQSYTFVPGHRYSITSQYPMAIPMPTQAQALASLQALFPGIPVTLVSVSQPNANSLTMVFDMGGPAPATVPVPPPSQILNSVTIADLGLTLKQ
jgi:hypothetical protein